MSINCLFYKFFFLVVIRLCLDKDSSLRIIYFCNKRPFKLKMRGALIPLDEAANDIEDVGSFSDKPLLWF